MESCVIKKMTISLRLMVNFFNPVVLIPLYLLLYTDIVTDPLNIKRNEKD